MTDDGNGVENRPTQFPRALVNGGTILLSQKNFIEHLELGLHISKFTAFDRLRELESKGWLQVDRSAGPRKTMIVLDIAAIAAQVADDISKEEEAPTSDTMGPLGPLSHDGLKEVRRLVSARILEAARIEQGGYGGPMTREFLTFFEGVEDAMLEKNPMASYSNTHVRALSDCLHTRLGMTTPNEFLNLLVVCELTAFADMYYLRYAVRPDVLLNHGMVSQSALALLKLKKE